VPLDTRNARIGQPFDIPLHHQGLVDEMARRVGVLEEMVALSRMDPRPGSQLLPVVPGHGQRTRDQVARHEVVRPPAVPRERGEVPGVAPDGGGVQLPRRESAALAECVDLQYLADFGQPTQSRVFQRALEPGPGPSAWPARGPARFRDVQAPDRLDQGQQERLCCYTTCATSCARIRKPADVCGANAPSRK
jgi:hypothetical protein